MQATFYDDLNAFLATPQGERYVGDIVFSEPVGPDSVITTARSNFRLVYLEDTDDQVQPPTATRRMLCTSVAGKGIGQPNQRMWHSCNSV